MTVAAISAGASAWWTTMAAVADVAIIAGSSYSAYSSYEQGKAQASAAKQQAEANAASNNAAARQAESEAVIAQIQGEQETAKRMRILSQDIGSQYASYAGNGLLVDGAKDSLGDVLRTTTAEGTADVNTIKDNAALNMWRYASQAEVYKMNAANSLSLGETQARIAKSAGTSSAISTGINGVATLATAGISGYGAFSNMNTTTTLDNKTKDIFAWNTTSGLKSSIYV